MSQILKFVAAGASIGALSYYSLDKKHSYISNCQEVTLGTAFKTSSVRNETELDQLRTWLATQGAKIQQIKFAQDTIGSIGVYVPQDLVKRLRSVNEVSWWRRLIPRRKVVVAEFPLSNLISLQRIIQEDKVGNLYEQFLTQGALSYEELMGIWLLVESQKGMQSSYGPYLAVLPKEVNVPLMWNPEQMIEIRGTSLYKAVSAQRKGMQRRWEQYGRELTASAFQACGMKGEATFEDFLWGYCVYMSRAIGLPPVTDKNGEQVSVGDAIVPGLDFCNHSSIPTAYWTVLGVEGKINGLPSIKLVKSDGVKLVPGAEVSLDYGSRSSEQFLFVYGFVNEDNPYQELYEEVMIPVQLQQFLSDPNIHERLLLLQRMGLKPQIFLQQMNETAGAKEQKYELPDQVVQILEVMVAPVQEVLAQLELESLEDISPPTQQQLYIDNKFRLMAILTTYVELLKQQLQVMESESEGTGRLEVDEKILEANTEIPYWKKCAIKYRMSQKRVLRQHFAAADTVLDQLMQDIMAMQKR